MPQLRKISAGGKSVKKTPRSKTEDKEQPGRKQGIILAAVVAVVILAIVGIFYYIQYVVPFQRTVIVVDDTSIKIDYFLKRIRLSGDQALQMLQTLTNELIIKQVAPQSPYNIRVTDEDIDEALRAVARGDSETISESEFREWYHQQLNETRLSNSEYRDLMYMTLLKVQLHGYLAERVPTVAEQVHLHITLLNTEEMEKIWEKYDEEEDLAYITEEIWLDKQSKGEVVDVGWVPHGAIDDIIGQAAFNLNVGEVSEPVPVQTSQETTDEATFCLIMVSEKAAAREVDEDDLEILKGRALDDWLIQESEHHKIEYHGRYNGYDSETDAWINWQLQRM